jgi:hypothetical protein
MPRLSTPRILPTSMRNDQRARHLDAGAHVGRAADDRQRFTAADIDLAQAQAIGIGMVRDREHAGDDDAAKRRRDRPQRFDLEAGHGEPFGELGGRDRRIAEFAQPGFGELHAAAVAQANWRRNRESPSKKRRRSSMP